MADRAPQQVAGFLAGHVDDDRARHRMAGHGRQRLRARRPCGRRATRAARRRPSSAPDPAAAAARCRAARRCIPDRSSRPTTRTGGWPGVRRGDLIRERAADPAEAEQHHVGPDVVGGAPAADLRQLEGRVHAPRGVRPRPSPLTANEMLRSDEPCAMATTLMCAAASAENTRAAMPGVPAMPSPTTASTAMPGCALTLSIRPLAISPLNAC